MLTDLKVSSLACKWAFYRPGYIANGDTYKVEFWRSWNTKMKLDGAERVNDKKGVICLVIMFTSRATIIRMSKMSHFFNFELMMAKNQSHHGQNI